MKNTGPDAATRIQVRSREYGLCLRCLDVSGEQIHHRKPRGMGGTTDPQINAAANLVWICARCHEWIEQNRKACYANGWLVRRNDKPAEVPLIMDDHRMIMLLPCGGMEVNQLPDNYETEPF